jgi:hypothetical protein
MPPHKMERKIQRGGTIIPTLKNMSLPIFARCAISYLLMVSSAELCQRVRADPIQLHPANPHYFLWQGKPAILVTATEHYGALLNGDFDYVRYLAELKKHQFNLTRVFSGTYREVNGSFNITGNTLAPQADRFLCPWARTDAGDKFDLSKWNAGYFERGKALLREADRQGVVVELVLFCTMYDDTLWGASPMNAANNVNGMGSVQRDEVYSGKDKELLRIQVALTRKLVTEFNEFDNVYFEICNEPYERGGLTREWNDTIVETIVQTEAALAKKHLIAQGFPPEKSAIPKLHRGVSVLNFHAASGESVRLNHHLNRVIAFDETGGSDQSDRKYRSEGWEFILAGGAVYDHLDFSFTTSDPEGSVMPLPADTPGGGGPSLRRQLSILKRFAEDFDLPRMASVQAKIKRIETTRSSKEAPMVRGLAEAGEAYAFYVNGGVEVELELELPKGAFRAEWINTKTGEIDQSQVLTQDAGAKFIKSPVYSEDIALRVLRQRK